MDTGFTSFFLSALCTRTHTHTHTLILLFIFLHYSDSLASSFPPSDDLLHCLLATQSKTIVSYPQCARHWLRVIRSRGHLRAESSWTLPSHAQYLTDHKMPSFLPLKYHTVLLALPPYCPPTLLLQVFIISHPEKCSCLMYLPASSIIPFHTRAAKDLIMN